VGSGAGTLRTLAAYTSGMPRSIAHEQDILLRRPPTITLEELGRRLDLDR